MELEENSILYVWSWRKTPYCTYGVGGKLLKAVQSVYVDSMTCVRGENDVSEWFPVNVGI